MKSMRRILMATLAVIMMFSLTSCGTNQGSETPQGGVSGSTDKIKIGGLAPLTGDVAVYGVANNNGAKLAFEEVNAKGGVMDKQIEFNVLDERGDPTEAVNAYNRLVSTGIVAILGDVTSKPSISVAQRAAEDGIPMISATATAEAVTEPGDNIFRVCFLDPYQGMTMAAFANENLKAKTAAVIYNISDDYSVGLSDAFKAKAAELGLEVVASEGYGKGDIDFKAQLTKISAKNPDVLFVPDYYNTVALIATQVKEIGLKSILLGADGWDGVIGAVESNQVSVLEGAYFCNHYSTEDTAPIVQNFLKAYKGKYNEEPNSFAALAYDTAYVLSDAIKRADSTDKAEIVKALKSTKYDGVTGTITFDEKGNPIKSVSIIKIVSGKYTLDSKITP